MSAPRASLPRPPRLATALLSLAVDPRRRDAVLGDLAEEYAERVSETGHLRAGLWYWLQASGSIPPLLCRRLAVARRHRRPPAEREAMSRIVQDLRYSLRGIRRNPSFALIVVLTLGLGIGANTIVFSAVDGVVLNPFPYPEPDRLVGVGVAFPRQGQELGFWEVLSPAEYLDIRNGSRTLDKVVAWDMGHRQVTFGDATENLFSAFWWGDAFPTLDVRAAAGRGFTAEEIERGERVAIISHRVWETRLAADLQVVGSTILINGEPYALVGVMPPRTLIYGTDLWIPMPVEPERFPRGRRQFQVLARVAPDAELRRVNVELESIARQVEAAHVGEFPEYEGWRLVARTWNDINVAMVRPAALILLGAVGFVLLLVCANVASLLLARSSARQRELAVRRALGAGRSWIVRQLLTESVVLGLMGGVVGVGLGYLGVRGLQGVLGSLTVPIPGDIILNGRVLAFTALVSLAAGVAFGIVPALQVSRSGLQSTLREEALSVTAGTSRLRLQRVFVGLEVALALVLLVGSGLLVRSFLRLQAVDPGFHTESMLTMRLTLARERYEQEEIEPFFQELRRRVEAIPGVTSVASASQFPPQVFSARRIWVEGREFGQAETLPRAYWTIASPGYFGTMAIPLVRGRVLTDADRRGAPFVAVINDEVADRFFPGEDPIGQRFKFDGPEADSPTFEIVGIVASTRNRGLDMPPQPELFVSSLQADGLWNQLFMLVRTDVAPRTVLPQVRAQVKALDPEQPVYAIRTVEEAFASSEVTRRVSTRVITVFGVFALILAAVGIYGVVSYAVTQRTREIGVRMALGAEAPQVRGLMLRQALVPVAVGAGVGLAASLGLGRLMSGLLYEVSGNDAATLAVTTAVLAAIALLASWVPALRASRVDPVRALRRD